MAEPVRMSDEDVRQLLGIVAGHREDGPAEGLPWSLLADLSDQIPSDTVSFSGLDTLRQTDWFGQALPAGGEDDDAQAFWAHYWNSEPCSYPDRTGDLRSVTKISDFYSTRQWHATGMHRDYLPWVEHELMLCLPAGPGRTVRLIFFRGHGPDFSERDRALLTLLRPHLREAYLNTERRRRGIPDLTPRHWALLRLVAAGATNAQIARRLAISEGTVRTHLENIFRRLGVSSRTAALARAFPEHAADHSDGRRTPASRPVTATSEGSQRDGPAGRLLAERHSKNDPSPWN